MFIIHKLIEEVAAIKTILTGIALIVATMLISIYLTIPMFLVMLTISAVIMAIGVIIEIKGGR
jgi:prepilin signal peptidase PulO-like enzyme (type II secretory pathway)